MRVSQPSEFSYWLKVSFLSSFEARLCYTTTAVFSDHGFSHYGYEHECKAKTSLTESVMLTIGCAYRIWKDKYNPK